jgi:uncharacterized repeat protein (TIGR01451 family)
MPTQPAAQSRGFVAALILGLLPLLGTTQLHASESAETAPLTATLTVQRVVTDAEGAEALEPADTARPGDLLEYRVVYVNAGDQALANVLATLPIPDSMIYQADTATPAFAQAATSDGRFGTQPLTRTTADAAGKPRIVTVPPAEYRSLRWVLGTLEPGESAEASARVRMAEAEQTVTRGEQP